MAKPKGSGKNGRTFCPDCREPIWLSDDDNPDDLIAVHLITKCSKR